MVAHGFTIAQMVELIRAGLAIAQTERVVAGGRSIEVEAIARWPDATIILRQGARVVHDSRWPRVVK